MTDKGRHGEQPTTSEESVSAVRCCYYLLPGEKNDEFSLTGHVKLKCPKTKKKKISIHTGYFSASSRGPQTFDFL